MNRRPFIVGNWKMHKGPAEADALATLLKRDLSSQTAVDVGVAPPYVSLPAVAARLKHTGIEVAAQDLHPEVQGAFTSAISGEMLRQVGCSYVIVGHSERRALFGDDDQTVGQKVQAAFRAGLLPILCVGETLNERDGGQAEEVVARQLEHGLRGLHADQVAAVTIAYEPIWAIGTGRTATPALAQEMHSFIRAWLRERYPSYVASQLRIQYGGSVKPDNAAGLLSQPDIDGALIGGASLDPSGFVAIIEAAAQRR